MIATHIVIDSHLNAEIRNISHPSHLISSTGRDPADMQSVSPVFSGSRSRRYFVDYSLAPIND